MRILKENAGKGGFWVSGKKLVPGNLSGIYKEDPGKIPSSSRQVA